MKDPARAVSVALAGVFSVILVTGCGSSRRAETATRRTSASPKTGLCKKAGIRYAGTTAEGVEICFTVTPDGYNFREVAYRFVRASGCPTQRKVYLAGPLRTGTPGYLEILESVTKPPMLTVTIRRAQASGIIDESDFCGGKKFKWSARATHPLPAQALPNLRPIEVKICEKPGIQYVGKTAEGAQVCFTLSPDGSELIESGWSFVRASGCIGVAPETQVVSDYTETVDPSGHFETDALKANILGDTASGVLSDSDTCPRKTFRWTAKQAQ